MGTFTGNISIHTKKYYRVVLESINTERETVDSFAIKMSMRMRIPLPRAKQVVSRLPYVMKRGLTAPQANRFKSILEDLGGKARLESHLVTPGEKTSSQPADLRSGGSKTQGSAVCPSCGWEEKSGAGYCPLCLRKFRDPGRGRATLQERLPDVNPLVACDEFEPTSWDAIVSFARHHRLSVLIGIIAVLLLIIVFK